jgi:hypothetical protein
MLGAMTSLDFMVTDHSQNLTARMSYCSQAFRRAYSEGRKRLERFAAFLTDNETRTSVRIRPKVLPRLWPRTFRSRSRGGHSAFYPKRQFDLPLLCADFVEKGLATGPSL